MAQEIYHRSEWGNPNEQWGNVYLNADLTNELYKRASEYENSWVTDQLLNGVGIKPSIILTPTAYEDGVLNSVKPAKTLGDNEVTNGTFDTDANWIKSNAVIANGKATITVVGGAYSVIRQPLFTYVNGRSYVLEAEVQGTSGKACTFFDNGANIGGLTTSNGVINFDGSAQKVYIEWTANANSDAILCARNGSGDFSFTIDNISVKEVIDADFDFTRGSSATRVNELGLVQDVQLLSGELVQNGDFEQIGSEQVVNGGFDTDSDWTKGTGWSISGGKAISDGTIGSYNLTQGGAVTVGKIYKITITVSDYVSGNVEVSAGASPRGTMNANGTYTFYQKATPANSFYIIANSFLGSVDNVSVKEVGQNWTLTQATVEDGKLLLSTTDGSYSAATQTLGTIGNLYRITLDVSDIVGTISVAIGGGTDIDITTNGTHTFEITSTSTTFEVKRKFGITNVSATIDNISVVEVTDDTDLPRINYTDGEGSLLLEPQSTNLVTYSEDFSEWLQTNATITSNVAISPSGVLNADKVIASATNTNHIIYVISSVSALTTYTFSLYAKADEYQKLYIRQGTGSLPSAAIYDLSGVGAVLETYGSPLNTSIELVNNEWYKITLTNTTSSSTPNFAPNIMGIPNSGYSADEEGVVFLGDGTSGVYIWGAQLEALSYATSYIPTNGSTVTRLADVCNNSGNSDLINSTEGVLYAEISAFANDGTNRLLSINNSTASNAIWLYFNTSNNVTYSVRVGGVSQASSTHTIDIKSFNKIAIKYKENDFALWINGAEVATDTSGSTYPSGTLNNISFDAGDGALDFYGNVKCVAVFKEALSDTELEKLTTI